jgi:hypothetical protein
VYGNYYLLFSISPLHLVLLVIPGLLYRPLNAVATALIERNLPKEELIVSFFQMYNEMLKIDYPTMYKDSHIGLM